ncbi:hypothetical protein HKX48_003772 [Thoreauomyces humboldtii]|nr:hypothetical protein HKX48_003772 [Thoreauomyces humboldtii]
MSAIPTKPATSSQLSGLYEPSKLQALRYGSGVVKEHLLSSLPTPQSRAFIVTGNSLAIKTPLIADLQSLLGNRHAGTFSNIKQHAPVAQLDDATEQVLQDRNIDTIISVGGGSPIDSAKAISFRVNEKLGQFLLHVSIPTTLSAAECAASAGYTQADGTKTAIKDPRCLPAFVFYDPIFALHTPPDLFASTGIRALDHAVELQYHPNATWIPCQLVAQSAAKELFDLLPKYKKDPKDTAVIIRLFLAAFASYAFLGGNTGSQGLGLSHALGYALGSPYQIPHGITSCLTLGHVVKLKARASDVHAAKIAALLPFVSNGAKGSGDLVRDADAVGDAILDLVERLGFKTTLSEKGVGKEEAEIIVGRATRGLNKKGELTVDERRELEGVRRLVEGLY